MNTHKYEIIPFPKGRKPKFKKGDKFNKLTVMECIGRRKAANVKETVYTCECECGTVDVFRQGYLVNKKTLQQCQGCINAQKHNNKKHKQRLRATGADTSNFSDEHTFFVSKLPKPDSVINESTNSLEYYT